jgi:UDP-N-acetyl-D-mannosaminuronic acid dehydrogenase
MKVSVIGLGYIGLPTAAILASKGVEVVGIDVNPNVVDTINKGEIHLVEPELDKLVQSVVQANSLRASLVVEPSDVFIIAVPTPFKSQHVPDISYIESAANAIAAVLVKGNLVILESTSPVGTTEKMIKVMQNIRSDLNFPIVDKDGFYDIAVTHCPERVLPGNIISELVENGRIIGGVTRKCGEMAKDLYKIFVHNECILTDVRTAELCKLVENSYRDVNIAFANELSKICGKLKIDVWELIDLANHHPRVNILKPGPGVGGHCIAVDPWFIVDSAPDESKLIYTARMVNDAKPKYVLSQITNAIESIDKEINEISVACFGLAFKADIDDLRESPAVEIAMFLDELNLKKLLLVEPNISEIPSVFSSDSTSLSVVDAAVIDSDIIVILVDHAEFKVIDRKLFSNKILIDTRGIYR